MKRIMLESPYRGPTQQIVDLHIDYARKCLHDALSRDEAPFVSHLLYPQVLKDTDPKERALGLSAGIEWRDMAELTVFYTDMGWSPGMMSALQAMLFEGNLDFVFRSLNGTPQLPHSAPDDKLAELLAQHVEKPRDQT